MGKCSCTTSPLGGGRWTTSRPGRFIPAKETQCPLYRRLVGPIWTGAENLDSTGIRSPDRPVCSESLYRLSYLGPRLKYKQWIILCRELVSACLGVIWNP